MRFLTVIFLIYMSVSGDDIELYKKLQKEVSKKDAKLTKSGDIKVYLKDIKDSNLTKSVQTLLKKEKIAKTTKKYEAVLKD